MGSCKNPVNSNESKDFVQSCRLLGKALAEADFMVIVGSSSTTTADYHILDGANEADRRAEILIMRPTEEDDSAAREGLLTNLSIQRQLIDGKWKDIRDRQVQAADAVVVIGGGHGTQAVIRAARSAHKPLLPLGVISGPARAAWPAARATLLASGIGQEAIDILEKGFDAMVIVSVIQSLLLSPRSDPDGLFPVEHIRDIVSQSGELPTGEKVTGELLLFDNNHPRQHTWLVASASKVVIVLDDEKMRAADSLIQKVMDKQKILPLTFGKSREEGTVGFAFRPEPKWYYSTSLFPTSKALSDSIAELINRVPLADLPLDAQHGARNLTNLRELMNSFVEIYQRARIGLSEWALLPTA